MAARPKYRKLSQVRIRLYLISYRIRQEYLVYLPKSTGNAGGHSSYRQNVETLRPTRQSSYARLMGRVPDKNKFEDNRHSSFKKPDETLLQQILITGH